MAKPAFLRWSNTVTKCGEQVKIKAWNCVLWAQGSAPTNASGGWHRDMG